MLTGRSELSVGARDLLFNCAELKHGESMLIICERPSLGRYDALAPEAAIREARSIGVEPTVLEVDGPESQISTEITTAVRQRDCTIFFARIGDQERFAALPSGCRSVMFYACNAEVFASAYGGTDHRIMVEFKRCVDELCAAADCIEISCELGTMLTGKPAVGSANELEDVSVERFPLAVPAPVLASGFSSRVALTRYLTPTRSMLY